MIPPPAAPARVRISRAKTIRLERSDLAPVLEPALVPRILLADQSPEARARIQDIVRNGEAVVDVASTANEIVALAALHDYAMFIIDKRIIGAPLAAALRRLGPRGRIATAAGPL